MSFNETLAMDILALSNLLRHSNKNSSVDEGAGTNFTTTSAVLSTGENHRRSQSSHGASKPPETSPKRTVGKEAIWANEKRVNASSDGVDQEKEEPKYQLYFKQIVGAEDAFLGMSEKTDFSADCSHIVVKVFLPGCSREVISLDVTSDYFQLETNEK